MLALEDKNPFTLDSKEPNFEVVDFLNGEKRYSSLETTFPENVEDFREQFEKYARARWETYKKMAD
jgi:pyruvate-ferredoxin/flavodoxin oxidoreductase